MARVAESSEPGQDAPVDHPLQNKKYWYEPMYYHCLIITKMNYYRMMVGPDDSKRDEGRTREACTLYLTVTNFSRHSDPLFSFWPLFFRPLPLR